MPVLKQGSTGPDVKDLQQKLKDLGFDPNGIDGDFGPGTEKAVRSFQLAKGLGVDGQVGPNTLAALKLNDSAAVGETATATSPLPNVTAAIVSKMFPGTKMGNIQTHLPIVLKALIDAGIADKDMVLMALGTIRAETAGFVPIGEGISHFNTDPGSHPFNRYDNRDDLGNQGRPDGASYKGRGFVQLTGRANYREHGQAIGLGNQLINNPELANQPDIAAKLLASFLKNKEPQIRSALAAGNLKAARKLVNGGSHGLDNFTDAFNRGKSLIT